jgi:hypothetical protein
MFTVEGSTFSISLTDAFTATYSPWAAIFPTLITSPMGRNPFPYFSPQASHYILHRLPVIPLPLSHKFSLILLEKSQVSGKNLLGIGISRQFC